MKVCDYIAQWMKDKEMRHAFGIIGAGNAAIFDAVHRLGYTQIVCTHHEQAAAMAANAYYRTCMKVAPVLVTTGGGSSNALTGCLAAGADSIPLMVISGNERSEHKRIHGMKGVQGYDSAEASSPFVKTYGTLAVPHGVGAALGSAMSSATFGRGGPSWLDIPMDIQVGEAGEQKIYSAPHFPNPQPEVTDALNMLEDAERPVIWLGNGVRLAGGADLVEEFADHFRCPVLLSWSGADLLDNDHWLHYGRPGVYGQRCANFVLENADAVLTIGTRLALPQTAYGHAMQKVRNVHFIDIDQHELAKFRNQNNGKQDGRGSVALTLADAKMFLERAICSGRQMSAPKKWLDRCDSWRSRYPWVESHTHDDANGFINSYRFMEKLQPLLKDDQVIVTDMGAALLSAHQALRLKKGQRLFTSQGLGEMGCGLPFAVGASFARNEGEVLCLNTDGGMMLNLQELATIAHHKLPIKIVVFCNDGYGMIKHTQDQSYGGRRVGVDRASGVSCPDFWKVFEAFGIPCVTMTQHKESSEAELSWLMGDVPGPMALQVHLDPNQKYLPKLSPGKPLYDLDPHIGNEELYQEMTG